MDIYNNTDNHGSREVEADFLVRANVQLLGGNYAPDRKLPHADADLNVLLKIRGNN